MTTPHRVVNPGSLAPPRGFAHAVVPASGRTVYLGGQAAHDASGKITETTMVGQFGVAAANVVEALRAAGGEPGHLVSLNIYVTDADAYRSALADLKTAYQEHFGDHYPAIALFEVSGLFDANAMVELVGIAVVPD